MTMLRVTADDGVVLQAQVWPGEPGGPVVLGLHGLSANRLGFGPLRPYLPAGATLVSLDARGRGLSDSPADPSRYGMRRHADDAAAVLRHLGLAEVVVVGHSMGAWVGLQLAAHHGDLVRGVVAVDGGWFADLPAGVTPRAAVDAVMGAGWDVRLGATLPSAQVLLDAFQAHPAFVGIWSDALAEHLLEGLDIAADGTATARCTVLAATADAVSYWDPVGQRPTLREDLDLVRCPVTLVRATAGFCVSPETMAPMMPEAACAEFAAELPGLRVRTVEGTNHYSVGYGPSGAAAIGAEVATLAAVGAG
ncbi:MAG: alpha/beta hydrolase [Rhodoferax sp.]|nr:alpha/beta hydrolase [Actinomycetota bacterium]